MTRTDAMLKLLAHGPLTPYEAKQITGWTSQQLHTCLDNLILKGSIERIGIGRGRNGTHYRLRENT